MISLTNCAFILFRPMCCIIMMVSSVAKTNKQKTLSFALMIRSFGCYEMLSLWKKVEREYVCISVLFCWSHFSDLSGEFVTISLQLWWTQFSKSINNAVSVCVWDDHNILGITSYLASVQRKRAQLKEHAVFGL